MKQFILRRGALLALAVVVTSCRMQKQEAPALTGPSEFAKSITVTVDPDSIPQDGVSSTTVTVRARGVNGEPLANLAVRADIRVKDEHDLFVIAPDFGTLSPRSVRTNAAGNATFVYTAPPTPSGLVIDEEIEVQIGVTPSESDFANSTSRVVSLLLMPPGNRPPQADFVFSPTNPVPGEKVLFNAHSSVPARGRTIVSYDWDFGKGKTGTGVTLSTEFEDVGSYMVTLTVIDDGGYIYTTTRLVTVVKPVGRR
jgi:PKD repeat protein